MLIVKFVINSMLRFFIPLLILLQLLLPSKITAQTSFKQNKTVFANSYFGFIVAHRPAMAHLVTSHLFMHEIGIQKIHNGEKKWEELYNYPTTGFSLIYTGLGDNPRLGTAAALVTFIDVPIKKNPHFTWNGRIGAGIGYISKIYHPEYNFENIAIGTKLNSTIIGSTRVQWHVTNKFSLEAGFGLTHFSNGSIKTPNLGYNIPAINLGINYKLTEPPLQHAVDTVLSEPQKMNYLIGAAVGLKENYPPGAATYWASSVSFLAEKIISQKSKAGLALDLFYDESLDEKLEMDSAKNVSKSVDFRNGIGLYYALRIGRVSLPIQMGMYLAPLYTGDGSFYHRVGFKYDFTKRLVGNISLKSHFGKADYFEFGAFYKIR